MRVTINDIAKAAGFSKTAVSFAFNDPGRISVETRDKILQTAERLGYVPDPVARNLSLKKLGTIGFVVPQAISRVFLNPYMSQIMLGIGEACQNEDYSLTVVPPLNGRIFNGVRSAAVDGFITLGLHPDMKLVQLIKQRHVPFVTIDGTRSEAIPGVNTNDEQSAYIMMKRILELGHRDVAIIALEPPSGMQEESFPGSREWRMSGFMRAVGEAGIDEPLVVDAESSIIGGRTAVGLMLADGAMPTAIACMSDIAAIGAITELQDRQIHVPGDISVTGFDDIPESMLISPRLTTIAQPGFDIGFRSASMLFTMLEDRQAGHHIYIDSSFRERESLAGVAP